MQRTPPVGKGPLKGVVTDQGHDANDPQQSQDLGSVSAPPPIPRRTDSLPESASAAAGRPAPARADSRQQTEASNKSTAPAVANNSSRKGGKKTESSVPSAAKAAAGNFSHKRGKQTESSVNSAARAAADNSSGKRRKRPKGSEDPKGPQPRITRSKSAKTVEQMEAVDAARSFIEGERERRLSAPSNEVESQNDRLHSEPGLQSESTFGVPTLICKDDDGTLCTKYRHLVVTDKTRNEFIQRKSFMDRYGFDPISGQVHDQRKVDKACPQQWQRKLQQSVSGVSDADSNVTDLGDISCDATLVRRNSERLDVPLGAASLQQDNDQKLSDVRAWAAWLKATIQSSRAETYSGESPPPDLFIFFLTNTSENRHLYDLIRHDPKDMAEEIEGHESLQYGQDVLILNPLDDPRSEDLSKQLEQLELAALWLWTTCVASATLLQQQFSIMRRENVANLDLYRLCALYPTLKGAAKPFSKEIREASKSWEALTGLAPATCKALIHTDDLLEDIRTRLLKRILLSFNKYVSFVYTLILPRIEYDLQCRVSNTPLEEPHYATDDFSDIASIDQQVPKKPLAAANLGARPKTRETAQAGQLVAGPPVKSLQSLKRRHQDLRNALSCKKRDFNLCPSHLALKRARLSTEIDKIQDSLRRINSDMDQNQPFGWRPTLESTRHPTSGRLSLSTTARERLHHPVREMRRTSGASTHSRDMDQPSVAQPGSVAAARSFFKQPTTLPRHLPRAEVQRLQQIEEETEFATESPGLITDADAVANRFSSLRLDQTFSLRDPPGSQEQHVDGRYRQSLPPRHRSRENEDRSNLDRFVTGTESSNRFVTGTESKNRFANRVDQSDHRFGGYDDDFNRYDQGHDDSQYDHQDGYQNDYLGGQDDRNSDYYDDHNRDYQYNRNRDYPNDRNDDQSDSVSSHHGQGDRDGGGGFPPPRFPHSRAGGGGDDDPPPPRGRGFFRSRGGGGGGDSPPPPGAFPLPPSGGRGQSDDVIRQLSQALMAAMNMPQGYSHEALEGFETVRAMEQWYLSLPAPWNKVPKIVGKRQDILKNVSLIFGNEKTFFGGKEDGSYFNWRAQAIENIHRQPVSVSDKVGLVSRAINKDNPLLKSMFCTQAFTAGAYRNIISSLETNFGGPQRAHNHLLKQLLAGDKLDWSSCSSVQLLRIRIDRYLELLAVHGIQIMAQARMTFDVVLTNVMTQGLALKFRDDSLKLRFSNPSSLEALSGWLQERERNLQWAASHHNVELNLRQLQPKPNRKVRIFEASGLPDAEGLEDGSVHSFPTRSDRKFIKDESRNSRDLRTQRDSRDTRNQRVSEDTHKSSTTFRVEDEIPLGEEGPISDTESLLTCSDIGEDFRDEEPHVQTQCLRTMGQRLPLCSVCKKERHVLNWCNVFRNQLSLEERIKLVHRQGRCDNCLNPSHSRKDCPSKFRCFECKGKHHTLLHFDKPEKQTGTSTS